MNTAHAADLPLILVIDDNQEILLTLDIILRRKSYRVIIKERMDNIEEAVKDVNPALILLDKSLGWADGCELCRQLKTNTNLSHIPVIMFSAYYKKRAECLAAGASDFVEKPFATASLLNAISACLNKN